jgi:hypothetical protein
MTNEPGLNRVEILDMVREAPGKLFDESQSSQMAQKLGWPKQRLIDLHSEGWATASELAFVFAGLSCQTEKVSTADEIHEKLIDLYICGKLQVRRGVTGSVDSLSSQESSNARKDVSPTHLSLMQARATQITDWMANNPDRAHKAQIDSDIVPNSPIEIALLSVSQCASIIFDEESKEVVCADSASEGTARQDNLVDELPNFGATPKSKYSEATLRRWLQDALDNSTPVEGVHRDHFFELAQAHFDNLSRNNFRNVWCSVVQEEKYAKWGKGGRRPKPKSIN